MSARPHSSPGKLLQSLFHYSKSQSLFFRYTRNVVNRNEPPTIGVDYSTKSIVLQDGNVVKAKIWDTGKVDISKAIFGFFDFG